MEDDDNRNSRNQFNDDTVQNQIVPQLRINISRKRKQSFLYDIRNFPDALLIEILNRLPVKSIFMFKCVCKHWQTLISHPSFCRFYHSMFNSNAALSRPFRILEKYTSVPNFREFINRLRPEIHSPLKFSVLFHSGREDPFRRGYVQYNVLDTSNGLILCRLDSLTQIVYYICDPLTGQWNTLRRRHDEFPSNLVEGLITRVNQDHKLIGYTVVRLDLGKSVTNHLNLEMFSSETGKWIGYKLPCTIPIQLEEHGCGTIHCYGALHWPVYNHNNTNGIHGLLAFDPYKNPKSVRLIPLPNDRDRCEYHNLGLCQFCGESQGTLRYFQVADVEYMADDDYLFTMWTMKDYEKGEWCCDFKVRTSDVHSSNPKVRKCLLDGWFVPLSFHPLNPNVVYLKGSYPECVVSYDVLNRRLDVACKRIDNDTRIDWRDAVPFMLPRWPVHVNKLSTSKESSSQLIK